MNRLISVVNKLQDIFNTLGTDSLQLPQIVVVGTQSSGKSSVLENIVGHDFLPRGTGMVTRRPLVLQLVFSEKPLIVQSTSSNKITQQEGLDVLTNEATQNDHAKPVATYAEFLHIPNKIYTNFEEVHDEIIRETNRILNDEKDVSSEPIRLRIYSPDVVNLTLVDLPGLTKIPIGRQAIDIENKILEMAMNYINNKNCIILAVTPANIDIATSEALKVASLADPKGERTIACLTKLDLMDRGTNAFDILSGKVVSLKLGIIGVVNRSQMDIDNKKPISQALIDEEAFFGDHYPMLSQWCGTKHLVKTLNKILLSHIHKCLPELKERIQSLLMNIRGKYLAFGDPITDKKLALLNIITKFVTIYSGIVSGTSATMTTSELCGGARIYYIYHELFGKKISDLDPLEGITKKDILTAVRNAKGMKPSLFVPEIAFELLVRKQIAKLEYPSIECITLVHEELLRIIGQTSDQIPEFLRFPVLKDHAIDVVKNVLSEECSPTIKMIHHLINSELSYINTNHPNFVDTGSTITDILNKNDMNVNPQTKSVILPSTGVGESENLEHGSSIIKNKVFTEDPSEKRMQSHSDLLSLLLKSYMNIIHHKFQDSVPKFTSCFLVNKILTRLQSELVDKLFRDELVDLLLHESIEIVSQRESLFKMIEALNNANKVISEVKEIKL